jgi:hypothetical protein
MIRTTLGARAAIATGDWSPSSVRIGTAARWMMASQHVRGDAARLGLHAPRLADLPHARPDHALPLPGLGLLAHRSSSVTGTPRAFATRWRMTAEGLCWRTDFGWPGRAEGSSFAM